MPQFARSSLVASALTLLASLTLGGCYAEAGAEPTYVEASSAPVDVELAPQYPYEGRTVYYVNDHWYAHDRGNWVYYRQEPIALYRYRTHAEEAPHVASYQARHEPALRDPALREVARPRREALNVVPVE